MSERRPTPEQRSAIGSTAAETMVEAGAGTGKTGVMVDRYCRLVCEEGVGPEEILAFTFTEKAAAELRQRIRAEIERLAAAGSGRARELLPGLGGAWVTTIHGFCNRLLSSHPVAVGIDPGFRVLDEPETERAAAEAFDEALESFLGGGGRERERTVAAFDLGGLRAVVLGVHAELRSRGEPEPRLPAPPEPDVAGALREAATATAEAIGELKPASAERDRLERALALLERPQPTDLDAIAALRTTSKAKALSRYREAVEAATARVAEAGEGGLAYRHVGELLELFSASFARAKRRRAGIDFEDLQLLALRLLQAGDLGAGYRDRFRHIMVDEFQDTNRLQLRLIEALRGTRTKLMVVGDELQSIYGFRHADLDVFRERRETIAEGENGELLRLSGNFRSRPQVIGAVNAIGERLLDDYAPLRVGAEPPTPPSDEGAAVELLLTGQAGWDEEGIDLDPITDARTPANQLAEARFLATRLRELTESGLEPSSMVVLLRAFTRLDAYEDSLERAGLKPYVVGGRGYWSQQQVADVCALLATLANPLDDQALLGALASPACGVAPDTLWLLRAAAGRGRHIWPAIEQATGLGEDERVEAGRIEQIPASELALLRGFAVTISSLRTRTAALSLSELIEAAVTETGYDLATLMRPNGEARFANVRKLTRLAAQFEAAEGPDLRGLLDFLAARAGADADAQAATAVEGHEGVRIMTVHSAKGLEFDVVAIPHLSRPLLAANRGPLLTLGREAGNPRVGMQLRRLGARAVDLYEQRHLCEEAQRREAAEELRLFHVAITRARERLLLSGVVRPSPPSRQSAGLPVLERIVAAFDVDRSADSTIPIAAPEPRPGLDASFAPSQIAVTVNLASVERATELAAARRGIREAPQLGAGPAPLVAPRRPRPPRTALSYTAISGERDELDEGALESDPALGGGGRASSGAGGGLLRGRAVHSLLEWSQANEWRLPPPAVIERVLDSAEVGAGADLDEEAVTAPLRAWLDSELFRERVATARSRAEVPLLIEVAGAILRGSIDLLVEEAGRPPLIVDYKTDRVGDAPVAELTAGYAIQQSIYALAVSAARGASEVEIAYVFLERPEEPFLARWGAVEIGRARETVERAVAAAGNAQEEADWSRRDASSSSRSSFSPSPTASSSAAQ